MIDSYCDSSMCFAMEDYFCSKGMCVEPAMHIIILLLQSDKKNTAHLMKDEITLVLEACGQRF